MPEVEIHVSILNLNYVVRGFSAIHELKEWLDEHASSIASYGHGEGPEGVLFGGGTASAIAHVSESSP